MIVLCVLWRQRLVEIGRHKDIEKITLSEVESITGQPGNFSVRLNKKPRYVDEEKCTGWACVSNCPTRNSVKSLRKKNRNSTYIC